MAWDAEFDFVSIGGGIGGLSAALTADECGMSGAVLEKSRKLGGVAALSLGQLWVPGNHLQERAGIADSWEAGFEYLKWMGAGYSDLRLAETLARCSAEAVRFFEEKAGVRWKLFDHYPDYFWPEGRGSVAAGRYIEVEPIRGAGLGAWSSQTRKGTASTLTNGEMQDPFVPALSAERLARDERTMGAGLAAYLVKAAIGRKVQIFAGFVVEELVCANGRVVGVRGRRDGVKVDIGARQGVLIATSGYDWDAQLVGRHDVRLGHGTRTQPAVTGDHLRWAGMLGAQVASLSSRPQWVGLAFRHAGEVDAEGMPLWQGVSFRNPHIILVNRHGRRFCDESWGPSYVAALSHADISRPGVANQPFWAIFDSEHRRRYRVGLAGPDDPLPAAVISAETVHDLAIQAGIDPEGLERQLERFNSCAARGEDPEFGRGTRPQARANGDKAHPISPNIGPIQRAPFHAVRLEACSIGIPTVGLVGDEHGRVLDWRNRPIAGLYGAGNSMAMLDLGIGYNSGLANTRGMVFAHLAALHAAGRRSADPPLA